MLVELRAGVNVCGVDGVEEELGNARAFHTNEVRLKQSLRRTEAFAPNLDDPAIRKLDSTRGGELD